MGWKSVLGRLLWLQLKAFIKAEWIDCMELIIGQENRHEKYMYPILKYSLDLKCVKALNVEV